MRIHKTEGLQTLQKVEFKVAKKKLILTVVYGVWGPLKFGFSVRNVLGGMGNVTRSQISFKFIKHSNANTECINQYHFLNY